MWIFTKNGFISAVQHREQPNNVMIRARRRDHLETFVGVKDAKHVLETENADYRFRITIPKSRMSTLIAIEIQNIEYDNFKNSIADQTYHDACLGVWSEMHNFQTGASVRRAFGHWPEEFDQ